MLKIGDQKPKCLGLQLSASKVEDPQLRAFGIQLSAPKLGSKSIMILGFRSIKLLMTFEC
jgi:hypothetical protein